MSTPVRIAVAGALGRMGQVICAIVEARPDTVLAARFDRPGTEGQDGLVSQDEALAAADIVIDFTIGSASAALALHCAERGGPALLIGSTGLSAAEERVVRAASRRIAVMKSGNFSLGVNMLIGLVRQAAGRAAGQPVRHRDFRSPPSAQSGCALRHRPHAGATRRLRGAASTFSRCRPRPATG